MVVVLVVAVRARGVVGAAGCGGTVSATSVDASPLPMRLMLLVVMADLVL